jgi:Mg2+ and Co2+ transporter CorA
MNFEWLPLVHRDTGFWWTLGSMGTIALLLGVVFWRKRYLARD